MLHKLNNKLIIRQHILFSIITIFSVYIFATSCKKNIEISQPETQIIGTAVYENDATAKAVMSGLYSRMMINYPNFGSGAVTLFAGLSSDEFQNFNSANDQVEFYTNSLTATNSFVQNYFWNTPYQYIYVANAVIEGLTTSRNVTQSTRAQLMGEARFMRAFCHFYLLNLFGEVPYITTTEYISNSAVARTNTDDVYLKIVEDLREAQVLLLEDYSYSSGERIRPNKWAAAALLARVYLYTGDWSNAELIATSIIDNISLFNLQQDLNNTFLKNSEEAIWQLMPAENTGMNTPEGNNFVLTNHSTSISLSDSLLAAFEGDDQRRINWVRDTTFEDVSYSYPVKYKIKNAPSLVEYYSVFRLAEQFLIRAEARAQLNRISEALSDLNVIRSRAGLGEIIANNKESILDAILHERHVELFAEWGHRWFDLKRTNKANAVFGLLKGSSWQTTDQLYPIPFMQLQNDPEMDQNPGY